MTAGGWPTSYDERPHRRPATTSEGETTMDLTTAEDQKRSERAADQAWRLLGRLRGWLRGWLRRGHRDVTPDGMFRMLLLTDDPWPTYIGTRSWCDGCARPCRVCGGQCCACRHMERTQRPRAQLEEQPPVLLPEER